MRDVVALMEYFREAICHTVSPNTHISPLRELLGPYTSPERGKPGLVIESAGASLNEPPPRKVRKIP